MNQKGKHAFNLILQDMKAGDIGGVCLLCGSEQFLVSWARDQLIKQYVNEATRAMDLVIFETGDFNLERFKEACDTMAMFSEKKVVVLEGFDAVWGESDKNVTHCVNEIIDYLPGVPNETLLIITAGDKEEIRRSQKSYSKKDTELFLKIKEVGRIYDFQPLSQIDLQKFILKRAHGAGKTISKSAVDTLISNSGYFNKDIDYALYNLENDLGKIIALSEGDEITEQAVISGLSDNLENNVFKMLDAVSSNRKETAFRVLDDMIRAGTDEHRLLATIIGQLELMLQVKELQEEGMRYTEIARKIKVHEFRAKKAAGFCQSFSVRELRRVLKNAFETDFRIKSGVLEAKLALEMLIAEI
jgi:DNA polymerase-3 subunit delta